MKAIRVAGAQLPNVVGDLEGNAGRIADAMQWAEDEGADVLILPELALTGYPLGDLSLHHEFVAQAEDALLSLVRRSDMMTTIISTIDRVPPQRSWDTRERDVAIAAKLVSGGEVRGTYHKTLLPTYGVYDEGRNFVPGGKPDALWRIGDVIAGVVICEDIWSGDGPPEAQAAAGARILLAPNASPYHRGKARQRLHFAGAVARRNGIPLVYLNFYGGQDDLVFDGGSLVLDSDGSLLHRCREFAEDRFCLDVPLPPPRPLAGEPRTIHTRPLPHRSPASRPEPTPVGEDLDMVWQALVIGTRDFARKNHKRGVVLGLSGGIDAAVTAVLAAEAVGAENVLGIAMPGPASPDDELRDAKLVASRLGIDFSVIPLQSVEADFESPLAKRLGRPSTDKTRRDLEAWARAAVLHGFAEEQELLILATGNKSELAIGKTTEGDLKGHFAPLRDCPKTLVYELGQRCNQEEELIPEAVFSKPTTAQRQDDAPPPYHLLDAIVERYLEQDARLEDFVAEGYDTDTVVWVVRRIDAAEFLRREVPLGVKITEKAFNQDRRMPISNAWRPYPPE